MNTIMSGEATPAQMAGFLVALRAKGETVDELAGLVEAMIANASPIDIAGEKLDIVGTGGDQLNTVNISTMAALVAAGAGRQGGQARQPGGVVRRPGPPTSWKPWASGWTSPFRAWRCNADEAGITFCFAQVFHPSMRHAAVARARTWRADGLQFPGPA